jgi:hypothetical protein
MEHPNVDLAFIEKHIIGSKKCAHTYSLGGHKFFIKDGTAAIAKRTFILDTNSKTVCFAQAVYLSHTFLFADELGIWFVKNRSWKDGAYIVTNKKN